MDDNTTTYAYMCNKCMQVYATEQETRNHVCLETTKNEVTIQLKTENGNSVPDDCSEIGLIELDHNAYETSTSRTTIIMHDKEAVSYEDLDGNVSFHIKSGEEYEFIEAGSLKRKRQFDNQHIRNKLVRDPYFKLDRHSYTFKDTLGDWDENSTKKLISLIAQIPDAHFVLKHYHERRLVFWAQIQDFMTRKGYNFTILQLRMRWRELFAKYRWTVNHNDLHQQKKSFEYMDDMNSLFGVWSQNATETLLDIVDQYQRGNNGSVKSKKLSYSIWERITLQMKQANYKYNVHQVEGRWKNLVTTYKSVIDHNIMPTVQPIEAAFNNKIEPLINYEPRRRRDYEKYKGKKVRLEKFPEDAMRHLISIYKSNSERFIDKSIKNADVWDSIQEELVKFEYNYTVMKLKEIFFATLKLYEKVLQHNSIPGAIKREGPFYKELSEIYNTYGCWPHVKRARKTLDEKQHRKFSLRLRESMQCWCTNESEALLKLYPNVLEKFMTQSSSASLDNDLWVQLAESFHNCGFSKKDVPEIATHIGLLRQGYWQKNKFPFNDLMQRVMTFEETLCYSPDVVKYTGDVEIYYWSHDAIHLMLSLYMRIQVLLPFSALTKEVYARISKEMNNVGYNYSKRDIEEEFRNLLDQFSRKYKSDKTGKENSIKDKTPILYREKMEQVFKLRDNLSVTFTNGIKPIPLIEQEIILNVGLQKSKEFFSYYIFDYEQQKDRLKNVIIEIRKEIKRILSKKPPAARKVCVQLLSFLFNGNANTSFEEGIRELHKTFEGYDFEKLVTDIMGECHNGSFQMSSRRYNLLDRQRRHSKGHTSKHQDDIFLLQLEINDGEMSHDMIDDPSILIPKLELVKQELEDQRIEPHSRTLYIDNDLGIKTTVTSNQDSQVMINIDEMDYNLKNVKIEPGQEEEEITHVIQDHEEYPCIDSRQLILDLKDLAISAKRQEKQSLKNLKLKNTKKKEILDFLLNKIKELS